MDLKSSHRYSLEIAAVLLLKLLLIAAIKFFCFSDRLPVSAQDTADRLLPPRLSEKSHD